jgi:hypothetical protein
MQPRLKPGSDMGLKSGASFFFQGGRFLKQDFVLYLTVAGSACHHADAAFVVLLLITGPVLLHVQEVSERANLKTC